MHRDNNGVVERSIRRVFQGRIAEIDALLAELTVPDSSEISGRIQDLEASDASNTMEPEESLRILMVRLVARGQRKSGTDEPLEKANELLYSTIEMANQGDLRFVDAWNSVFEKIYAGSRAPLLARIKFLIGYRSVLRNWIAHPNA